MKEDKPTKVNSNARQNNQVYIYVVDTLFFLWKPFVKNSNDASLFYDNLIHSRNSPRMD